MSEPTPTQPTWMHGRHTRPGVPLDWYETAHIPTPVQTSDHVALRPTDAIALSPQRVNGSRADRIAGRVSIAATVAILVLVALAIHGPLVYIAIAVLAGAIATRVALFVDRAARRLQAGIDRALGR